MNHKIIIHEATCVNKNLKPEDFKTAIEKRINELAAKLRDTEIKIRNTNAEADHSYSYGILMYSILDDQSNTITHLLTSIAKDLFSCPAKSALIASGTLHTQITTTQQEMYIGTIANL